MSHSLTDFLTEARLNAILNGSCDCRVGVVGDLALDGYWTADMTRAMLSRETPHFPKPIIAERYAPGAGGNVAQNLAALGVRHVAVFSVTGADWRGELLHQELVARGVDMGALIVTPAWRTTAYLKPLLTGYEIQQEDARLDFENVVPLSDDLQAALIARVTASLDDLDALIVADQFEVNGVVTDGVREALIKLAGRHPDRVFVADSRTRIDRFRQMVLKPNWREAALAVGQDPARDDPARQRAVAAELAHAAGRLVALTRGARGVLIATRDEVTSIPAAPVTPPLDPVGAGDAFVATLAMALAVGATPTEAGALANLAAAVIVEKLKETGTATPEELRTRWAHDAKAGDL